MNKKNLFSNIIIYSGIFFFLALLSMSVYKSINAPGASMMKYYVISIAGASIFACALKLRDDLKINFSLLVLSISIGILLVEIYLAISAVMAVNDNAIGFKARRVLLAEKEGRQFDTRDAFQVMQDLDKKGIQAFPSSVPHNYINTDGLTFEGEKIYPLSSISGTLIIHCNETGEHIMYESDKHGFNNPDGHYNENDLEIALIGDSFVQGNCVQQNEGLAGWMRESGKNVLNLGMGANGPLIELATLAEYAKPFKPETVIWFYYEGNDQDNLKSEQKSNLLKQYLSPDFSQGLISNQKLADKAITEYIKKMAASRKSKKIKSTNNHEGIQLSDIIKLSHLRNSLKKLENCTDSVDPLFEAILTTAQETVKKWGGQFYLVYLPSIERYSEQFNACKKIKFNLQRKQTLLITNKLGIPTIDIYELLSNHDNLYSLFPFRLETNVHFNSAGYRLVSEHVLKEIEKHLTAN